MTHEPPKNAKYTKTECFQTWQIKTCFNQKGMERVLEKVKTKNEAMWLY